jgi:hypothetical protein
MARLEPLCPPYLGVKKDFKLKFYIFYSIRQLLKCSYHNLFKTVWLPGALLVIRLLKKV